MVAPAWEMVGILSAPGSMRDEPGSCFSLLSPIVAAQAKRAQNQIPETAKLLTNADQNSTSDFRFLVHLEYNPAPWPNANQKNLAP